MITRRFLESLEKKLKVGNLRSIHLNAIPGPRQPRLDLVDLNILERGLANNLFNDLTNRPKFNFRFNYDSIDPSSIKRDEVTKFELLFKKLNNISYSAEDYFLEHGIKPFGFGYPILIKRLKSDPKKIVKAPLLIWSLDIQRSTRKINEWFIGRDEDYQITINPLLQSHLQIDEEISINGLDESLLDKGFLNKEEILEVVKSFGRYLNFNNKSNLKIESCTERSQLENITGNIPWIIWSGIFGMYLSPKESIVKDVEKLQSGEGFDQLDSFIPEPFQRSSITRVETDPSQERIINCFKNKHRILIQGPPGTGKSQTITAIITNALENKAKILVVCEKKTALDVIERNLHDVGLRELCVIIDDVNRDRKKIIDKVRERLDNKHLLIKYNESKYQYELKKYEILKNKLNIKLSNTGKEVFGNYSWKDLVGIIVEARKKHNYKILLDSIKLNEYSFSYEDYENLIETTLEATNLFRKVSFDSNPYNLYHEEVFTEDYSQIIENKIKHIDNDTKYDVEKLLDQYKNNSTRYSKIFLNENKRYLKLLNIYKYFSRNIRNALIEKEQFILSYKKFELEHVRKKQYSYKFYTEDGLLSVIKIHESLVQFSDKLNGLITCKASYYHYHKWRHFLHSLNKDYRYIILTLAKKIKVDKWVDAIKAWYNHMVLQQVEREEISFIDDESEIKQLESILAYLKKQQINKIRSIWFEIQKKSIERFQKKEDVDVKALYNYKKNNKFKKRNSLRNIIERDFNLFTDFFPVILINPVVCSSILPLKEGLFKIVIFDEASQLRIEDTFSAYLRGEYKVISGDRHQMPPSNYFSIDNPINTDTEETDEENSEYSLINDLADCESLLDFAEFNKFENVSLDFHYRSRHNGLIDFSNAAFYGNKLIPMPNKHEYVPIKLIQINGKYLNRSNSQEAKAVVKLLFNYIKTNKDGHYPSIGVATTNINQRNLIIEEINNFLGLNPDKLSIYEKIESSGFFVKNLENIQGDEKDIIIISTAFGLDENNTFRQHFGPINLEKGYRLLNVIVTRAKYRVYICTSIPENVYRNYKNELMIRGNSGKAIFYAYLSYAESVSLNNIQAREEILHTLWSGNKNPSQDTELSLLESPFEDEVYNVLKDIVGEENIIPQYKCGGFRIDFVIKLRENKSYMLAIECDGAAYHSSNEAYAWDMYRQKILEGYGFVFYRIYSTNWWRNYDQECEKLKNYIAKHSKGNSIPISEQYDYAETLIGDENYLFPDVIETKYLKHKKENIKTTFTELIDIDNKESIINANKGIAPVKAVNEKSIVTVTNLQNNVSFSVKFTSVDSHIDLKSPVIKIVHVQSPLAEAILGKSENDRVQVSGIGAFYEIVKIE